jgi:alpha/beta superfamily hydrolase
MHARRREFLKAGLGAGSLLVPKVALALLALGLLRTGAAFGDEVVTLATRPGVTQSFLLLETRGAAKGVVIMLPGHEGKVEFRKTADDGYEVRDQGGGLTAHRAMRETLRKGGFAVAVIAPPSDQRWLAPSFRKGTEHLEDMRNVIGYLQKRYGSKPYLQGHCLASFSAASVATRLKSDGISGLIMSSTRSTGKDGSVTDFERGTVSVPVLLVHHRDDSCPQSPYYNLESVKGFYKSSAPKVDTITVTGGVSRAKRKQQSCQDGYHGFKGMQKDTAQAIVSWLLDKEFPVLVEGVSQ